MEVNTTSTADPINMYNYINNYVLNPVVFIIIALIIIGYLVIFSSLGNNESNTSLTSNNDNSYGQSYLGMFVIIIFVILILINGFQYFFNISITAYLKDLFTDEPKIEIVANQSKNKQTKKSDEDSDDESDEKIKLKKQVFNIPGNHYNYNDAKAVCNAYGADLATYQQIESAYKKGAEWCNYGWSDGQMALFPTQQKTYDTLQTIEGHEHDCGRPGINGGYMANPEIKYGVNCYGIKPSIRQDEEEMMKTISPYPKTMKDIEFQKKVDHWKSKIHEIMISPFNYNMWGEV
jgi:hypothetical protein